MPDTHQQRFALQQEGKGLYLIAWNGEVPVGYVFLHFRNPPYHGSYRHYPECAYVEGLTTWPDYQRQGIATSLMEAAENHARGSGVPSLGISVGKHNAAARAFYRKIGYCITSVPFYRVSWTYLCK
jgi:ribosomal protein S18 acetylase RimI-like enzyme